MVIVVARDTAFLRTLSENVAIGDCAWLHRDDPEWCRIHSGKRIRDIKHQRGTSEPTACGQRVKKRLPGFLVFGHTAKPAKCAAAIRLDESGQMCAACEDIGDTSSADAIFLPL